MKEQHKTPKKRPVAAQAKWKDRHRRQRQARKRIRDQIELDVFIGGPVSFGGFGPRT